MSGLEDTKSSEQSCLQDAGKLLPMLAVDKAGKLMFANTACAANYPNWQLRKEQLPPLCSGDVTEFKQLVEACFNQAAPQHLRPWIGRAIFNGNALCGIAFVPLSIIHLRDVKALAISVINVCDLEERMRNYEMMCDGFNGFLFLKRQKIAPDGTLRIEIVEANKFLVDQFCPGPGLLRDRKAFVRGKTDFELHPDNPLENDFFFSEDSIVFDTGTTRRIPGEPFTCPGDASKVLTLSTTKHRELDPLGTPLLVGSSFEISALKAEWEHSDSLFDVLLRGGTVDVEERRRHGPRRLAAKHIAEHAKRSIEASTLTQFDAVQVIQHDPKEEVFQVVTVVPEDFWPIDVRAWPDSENTSISGWVLRNGAHACHNYNDPQYSGPRPYHTSVTASVCVPIMNLARNAPWGVISAVSMTIKERHQLERAKRLLERYAMQTANVLRVSELIETERASSETLMSLFIQAHEVSSPIQKLQEDLEVVERNIEKLVRHAASGLNSTYIERIKIAAYQARQNAAHLHQSQQTANEFGRFLRERENRGLANALTAARRRTRDRFTVFDISFIIQNEIDSYIYDVKNNKPNVVFRRSEQLSHMFCGDEMPLRAAVRNLIRNAHIYGNPSRGSPTVEFSIRIRLFQSHNAEKWAFIVFTNAVNVSQESSEKIAKLKKFFLIDDIPASECPGWGTAVAKFATFVHEGKIRAKYIEQTSRLQIWMTLRNYI